MRRLMTTAVVCTFALAVGGATVAAASPSASAQPVPMPHPTPLPPISLPIFESVGLHVDPAVAMAGGSVDATVVNRSNHTVGYGLAYAVDRWTAGGWRATDLAPDRFAQIYLRLAPGQSGTPQTIVLPADVRRGLYRVVKRVQHEDTRASVTLRTWFLVGSNPVR